MSERLGSLPVLVFSVAGTWPPVFDKHINYLEFKAIYYGLLALLPHIKDYAVKLYLIISVLYSILIN